PQRPVPRAAPALLRAAPPVRRAAPLDGRCDRDRGGSAARAARVRPVDSLPCPAGPGEGSRARRPGLPGPRAPPAPNLARDGVAERRAAKADLSAATGEEDRRGGRHDAVRAAVRSRLP